MSDLGLWNDLVTYLREYHKCCMIKNLSSEFGKNEIYIAKICNVNSINKFYQIHQKKKGLTDMIYCEPGTKFIAAIIPKHSEIFINLFCCKVTMMSVHNKISKYGLALEGCFNINPLNMTPDGTYQGTNFNTNKKVNIEGFNRKSSYLLIDNHKILKIVNYNELETYNNEGINVQCVEGFRLFETGRPFMDTTSMKNIKVNGIDGLPDGPIDGARVMIDYFNKTIKIDDKNYNFSEIGKHIHFINESSFIMSGLLVVATDINDNILIFYHPKMDHFSMVLLLSLYDANNAIVICKSSKAHIIWKEAGMNKYNKTDFIGNISDPVSNVITFCG